LTFFPDTDSGIQSVGDSIRGSSDSMSNAASNGTGSDPETSAADSRPSAEAASKSLVSIEQQVFGGKIETTYECCACRTVSIHRESFNDLVLNIAQCLEMPFILVNKVVDKKSLIGKRGLRIRKTTLGR
jgi:hypothetical protein